MAKTCMLAHTNGDTKIQGKVWKDGPQTDVVVASGEGSDLRVQGHRRLKPYLWCLRFCNENVCMLLTYFLKKSNVM